MCREFSILLVPYACIIARWYWRLTPDKDMIDFIPTLGLRSWISKVGILEQRVEGGRSRDGVRRREKKVM
jgi:hypothetical protein